MTLGKNVLVMSALASALIFTGCTKETTKIIQEKQAPADATKSFSAADPVDCSKISCVKIQKSSLGRIFLLIASGVTGGSTPQWYDLKPQVVKFERSGGRIGLIGQNYNSIYEEIPSDNLLQTFAIVAEDDSSITFDVADGFKSFVAQSPYDVDSARGLNNDLTETSYSAIPVSDSMVKDVKYDAENIEFTQRAKIQSMTIVPGEDKNKLNTETREESITMNVQIRPQDLEPKFKAKEYDSSRRVGFFVSKRSKPKYSKEITNIISRWDLSPEKGPVRIRISKSVPADYVQAVTEGALYWNLVFGRDVVKVETGVDPKEATPQNRSIMIRWIEWLDAGAAYAISQSDPLTGEILRAQVFMPSVFTKVGSADLTDLNGKAPVVVNGAVACDFSQTVKDLVKLSREASDSQRLRLAQDSVRATVAHELGHAFGLRHNFAGSFSAKVSVKDINEATKTYLKDPNHHGLETTTSIMDYVSGVDNILSAARIKYAPLSYDKMAMDWAYSDDNSILDESISKYCTDDDIALANSQGLSIYGCERFDAGNNPLQRKYLDTKDEKENFINVLFASIIGRMYPPEDATVVNNLDQVIKDTVKWGKLDVSGLGFVTKAVFDMSKDGQPAAAFASLQFVKNGKILYSKFGQDIVFKQTRAAHLSAAGGYAAILNGLMRDSDGAIDTNWMKNQIIALAKSGYLQKGKTLGGREYELTEVQQQKILAFFQSLADLNKKALVAAVYSLLPKVEEPTEMDDGTTVKISAILAPGLLTQADAASLASLALDLLTQNAGTTQAVLGENKTAVDLPVRYLTSEERVAMLKLLSSQGLNFSQSLNKANVRNVLVQGVNDVLKQVGVPELDTLSAEQKQSLTTELLSKGLVDFNGKAWLDAEIEVINGLDAVK